MINRNNYPINEPIFPHWMNVGAKFEDVIAENHDIQKDDNGNLPYIPWKWKEEFSNLLTKDNGRWRYMEIKIATKADEDRECKRCKENHEEAYKKNPKPFKKGTVVIREQFSQQDFTTLHPQCSIQKINKIKEELNTASDRLMRLIYESAGIIINTNQRQRN